METAQVGADVIRNFGEMGGILGLIIAVLFCLIFVLAYLFHQNTKAILELSSIMQRMKCIARNTEIRERVAEAVR